MSVVIFLARKRKPSCIEIHEGSTNTIEPLPSPAPRTPIDAAISFMAVLQRSIFERGQSDCKPNFLCGNKISSCPFLLHRRGFCMLMQLNRIKLLSTKSCCICTPLPSLLSLILTLFCKTNMFSPCPVLFLSQLLFLMLPMFLPSVQAKQPPSHPRLSSSVWVVGITRAGSQGSYFKLTAC